MNIEKILKDNCSRVTKDRIDMFNLIRDKHIFSYSDILCECKWVWRASIFRNLNLFFKLWIIRKLDMWNNRDYYEYNNYDEHHEHMKCKKCNTVISFDAEELCKKIFLEANKLWFKVENHSIWIQWICNNCLLSN